MVGSTSRNSERRLLQSLSFLRGQRSHMSSPPSCSVPGCTKPSLVKSRRLCTTHYHRWSRHGDPLATKRVQKAPHPTCSVEGCNRTYDSHGYCSAHADRWRKHGTPSVETPIGVVNRDSLEVRLWRRVQIAGPNDCWNWTGPLNPVTGYGQLSHREPGTTKLAHRLMWLLTYGPIPPSYQVDHKCENKRCCNVAHLVLATPYENARRGAAKRFKTLGDANMCRHGHVGQRKQRKNGDWYCQGCNTEWARQNRMKQKPSLGY
jgi:hypothetical protein